MSRFHGLTAEQPPRSSAFAERQPHLLRPQFVEQPHDVVRRQLDEHRGGLGVLRVAQRRLERPHRRDEPFLLAVELLLRDLAVGERARERLQLLDLLLEHRMTGLFVEPACTGHNSLLIVR